MSLVIPYAVAQTQTRQRQHGLNAMDDLEVWGYSDAEIIGVWSIVIWPIHSSMFTTFI